MEFAYVVTVDMDVIMMMMRLNFHFEMLSIMNVVVMMFLVPPFTIDQRVENNLVRMAPRVDVQSYVLMMARIDA